MEEKKDNSVIARASHQPVLRDRFNAAMLATAREARFLSQAALAKSMCISQALVGKWEAGLGTPDTDQIAALAAALDVQPELFFVDRSRRLASMSDYYHRALAKAKRRDVKAIHARCSIMDIQIDRLLEIAELPEDRIPDFDSRDHAGDTEKIAAMARTAMGIGSGPIPNLVEEIERCGAIVIDRQLEVDDVDALCRWVPEMPKLFFLNGSRPADRIRFSLAHELGHTIMHFGRDYDQKIAEDQANSFAAAFLMPADDIRPDFQGAVRITDLAAIKRKWRVAMQAAARRAHTLNMIDDRRFKMICIQMSRQGWRKSEPVSIDGESPQTLARLLRAHVDAGYSRTDLVKLLMVSEKEVDFMIADANAPNFHDQGVRLRLVRDDS